MINRNRKTNDSDKNSVSSHDELSETTEKNTENKKTETETPNVTTEATTETITEPTTNIADLNIDTSEAAKKAMYTHLDNELHNEETDKYYFFNRDVKYALYAVNADGIDELFISYADSVSIGSDLYIYKNGEYVKSHRFAEGAKICLSEHLLMEKVYGGGEMTKIYVISDNEILQKDELDEWYGNNSFHHNDYVIDESEYNQLKSKYDSLDWIDIPDNSHNSSKLVDMSAYAQNKVSSSDPYADIKQEILYSVDNNDYSGKDSHIENAPSDMVFYSTGNRSSLNISYPIVYEGPGTNYAQILTYQERFDIVAENNNWYYIQWYEGTGRASHSCYGYLNKNASNNNNSEYTDKSNLIATGKVITEKDNLNMRKSNSDSSEITTTIPNSHYVGIISEYGDWFYVKYYADTNSPIYYGYVSKQFIEIT